MTENASRPAIGLIAGGGQFPLLFAEAARKRGRRVVAIAHTNETLTELKDHADVIYWVKLGQLGKIIRYFRSEQVEETVFAGTITKTRIFHDVLPDLKGLTLWSKIDTRLDDAILRAVAATLEEEGIQVLASTCYLDHLFFPRGVLSRKKPSAAQMEDIRFGWSIARAVGSLDIGQCVVVRDRSVLAVEAIEGTDAAIRRGGELAGSGAVVVKVRKPGQDFRFDLPATGVGTIETLVAVKGAVLAVEAGESLLFDREAMVRAADRAGIVVVGLGEDEQGDLRC
ncbi:LpxI family protein [Desulfobulbus alkaliphilus]|uniref:LpxI family protein n=1 Tax=Desulfobulbus alkaliphilus TaxID=869814 RepID=UPI0019628CEE|nr:UDP-2,3-diacylglucosamine diphosphatase LpxI [Desulfobulbus alkaliphilus]MBM9537775.1 UDP-2,3-diacylglucosamine diphosphatase LpxI [Desulfobulbus alkaliphilus]